MNNVGIIHGKQYHLDHKGTKPLFQESFNALVDNGFYEYSFEPQKEVKEGLDWFLFPSAFESYLVIVSVHEAINRMFKE